MTDSEFDVERGIIPSGKVHERIKFEQWIYEHLCEMSIVQAQGNNKQYEMMLNTLMDRMYPYMTDEEIKKNEDLGKQGTSYGDTENYNRIRQKTRLTSTIMDRKGLQFTEKKKAEIRGGLELLWYAFPPLLPTDGDLKPTMNGNISEKH
jgi:hypothetical protein